MGDQEWSCSVFLHSFSPKRDDAFFLHLDVQGTLKNDRLTYLQRQPLPLTDGQNHPSQKAVNGVLHRESFFSVICVSGGPRKFQPGIYLANLVFILQKILHYFTKIIALLPCVEKKHWYSLEYHGIPLAPPLICM
jgi:hypothetical protein